MNPPRIAALSDPPGIIESGAPAHARFAQNRRNTPEPQAAQAPEPASASASARAPTPHRAEHDAGPILEHDRTRLSEPHALEGAGPLRGPAPSNAFP
ncbi:hypothetical protein GCM10009853_068990 [Glycomyces scopariae]